MNIFKKIALCNVMLLLNISMFGMYRASVVPRTAAATSAAGTVNNQAASAT